MIKIKDDIKPDYLDSDTIKASKERIKQQVTDGIQSLTIPYHWNDPCSDNKIKDVLFSMHHEKCGYCERKRTRKREMDVEHYRPKAKVDREATHKGYWWLAYDWDNYLWSCKSCNQGYKKNEFPLLSGGVRAETEGDDLSLEKPCLINPRFEDPCEYLAYYMRKLGGRWLVSVMTLPGLSNEKKQRGEETIRILGLNRDEPGDDLVSERGEHVSAEFESIVHGLLLAEQALKILMEIKSIIVYEKKISEYKERLKAFVHPSRIFSGFFRHYLTYHDIDYSDLIEE